MSTTANGGRETQRSGAAASSNGAAAANAGREARDSGASSSDHDDDAGSDSGSDSAPGPRLTRLARARAAPVRRQTRSTPTALEQTQAQAEAKWQLRRKAEAAKRREKRERERMAQQVNGAQEQQSTDAAVASASSAAASFAAAAASTAVVASHAPAAADVVRRSTPPRRATSARTDSSGSNSMPLPQFGERVPVASDMLRAEPQAEASADANAAATANADASPPRALRSKLRPSPSRRADEEHAAEAAEAAEGMGEAQHEHDSPSNPRPAKRHKPAALSSTRSDPHATAVDAAEQRRAAERREGAAAPAADSADGGSDGDESAPQSEHEAAAGEGEGEGEDDTAGPAASAVSSSAAGPDKRSKQKGRKRRRRPLLSLSRRRRDPSGNGDSSDSDGGGSKLLPRWRCVNRIREGHGQAIYTVQFNLVDPRHANLFATASGPRVTVYRLLPGGGVDPIQLYVDEDPAEYVYTLAWSIDLATGAPLLVLAGKNATIRILDLHTRRVVRRLVGHGAAVNDLRVHPLDPRLLLSSSKDASVRLWNTHSGDLVAVFGGEAGHRDEVLSADWHPSGELLASSGMDHSIKIWTLDARIKEAIRASYLPSHQRDGTRPFPTVFVHFPAFATNRVHDNYVDHVRWLGDALLSKSTEDKIVMWKVRQEYEKKCVHRLLEYTYSDSDIWYIRFALSHPHLQYLAVGNKTGAVFVWSLADVSGDRPQQVRKLVTQQSQRAVRCVAFSADARTIIAACEDGSLFRWDQLQNDKGDKNGGGDRDPAAPQAKQDASLDRQPQETLVTDATPKPTHTPAGATPR